MTFLLGVNKEPGGHPVFGKWACPTLQNGKQLQVDVKVKTKFWMQFVQMLDCWNNSSGHVCLRDVKTFGFRRSNQFFVAKIKGHHHSSLQIKFGEVWFANFTNRTSKTSRKTYTDHLAHGWFIWKLGRSSPWNKFADILFGQV